MVFIHLSDRRVLRDVIHTAISCIYSIKVCEINSGTDDKRFYLSVSGLYPDYESAPNLSDIFDVTSILKKYVN